MGAYDDKPRDYALSLVEQGLITAEALATCLLKFMPAADVRLALDMNELSPRFLQAEEEDE